MKHIKAKYIESGAFQGGEEDVFTAGINHVERCVVMSEAQFEKIEKALIRIANYQSEPIWNDDRDDAADEMVRIAERAISDKEEEE